MHLQRRITGRLFTNIAYLAWRSARRCEGLSGVCPGATISSLVFLGIPRTGGHERRTQAVLNYFLGCATHPGHAIHGSAIRTLCSSPTRASAAALQW